MATFKNTEELNKVLLALWERIKSEPEISVPLLKAKISIAFIYREPESILTIDCSDSLEMKVYVGKTNFKPTVVMSMKSDLAHNFWYGKVNIPLAIISGKIVSRGPVNQALALLPVIKPAFNFYPDIYFANKSEDSN